MIQVFHNHDFSDALWGGEALEHLKPIQISECTCVADVDTDELYVAYEKTQNGHLSVCWQDNKGVTPLDYAVYSARSTSAGDILLKDGEYFVLAGGCTIMPFSEYELAYTLPYLVMQAEKEAWNSDRFTVSVRNPYSTCLEDSYRHVCDGTYRVGAGASFSLAACAKFGMTAEQHDDASKAVYYLFHEDSAVSVQLESGFRVEKTL